MIFKKDSEIVKVKVERNSLAFKNNLGTTKRPFKEARTTPKTANKSKRKCFRCGDPNHLIGECPKPPRDKNQRAFVGGSWSDSGEDDEKIQDETCLVAQAPSEICIGVDLEPNEWIKDNGCSKHMTGNRKLLSTYNAYNRDLTLVDDIDLDEEEAIKVTEKKNLENNIEDETLEIDEIVNIKESRNHPLENVIGSLNQSTLGQGLNQMGVASSIRLVAHATSTRGIDYDETSASVAGLESIRYY
ncbi:retrovirus-related pol polyprotein from transposon TNT 1-94 [Tanacetum coccineum]